MTHPIISIFCNRCDVPVQIEGTSPETARAFCLVCGKDFGYWTDIEASAPEKIDEPFRDRESWRAIERQD